MSPQIINFLVISLMIMFTRLAPGQEPPHEVMELDCQVCHNPDHWTRIQFDHTTTGFELEGNHQLLWCDRCHSVKNFQEVKKDCGSCHVDVHQGRLGPWCRACHTPRSWTVIDHSLAHAHTTFPLLGVHARIDCESCHYSEIEGNFSPLQSECYSCHEQDYQSVSTPNHLQSGFSKQCQECHSFYAWKPAQFVQHDAVFPIFNGNHAGVWNDCSDCHISPGNFAIFSCLNCHEHRRDRMDREHDDVNGYVYESQACYNCHPTGGKGNDD